MYRLTLSAAASVQEKQAIVGAYHAMVGEIAAGESVPAERIEHNLACVERTPEQLEVDVQGWRDIVEAKERELADAADYKALVELVCVGQEMIDTEAAEQLIYRCGRTIEEFGADCDDFMRTRWHHDQPNDVPELTAEAVDEYLDLIKAIAAGETVDLEQAEQIIEAVGRSPEEFQAAVDKQLRANAFTARAL